MSFVNQLKNNFRTVNTQSNSFLKRKNKIEEFIVVHPLFQTIVETKINKCFQHGHIRNYNTNDDQSRKKYPQKILLAPTISGSRKYLQKRPSTSRISMPIMVQKIISRPKSTSTVIRSRTTEPKVRKKLEMLAKQEMDDESLKPSLTMNRRRRKKIQSNIN